MRFRVRPFERAMQKFYINIKLCFRRCVYPAFLLFLLFCNNKKSEQKVKNARSLRRGENPPRGLRQRDQGSARHRLIIWRPSLWFRDLDLIPFRCTARPPHSGKGGEDDKLGIYTYNICILHIYILIQLIQDRAPFDGNFPVTWDRLTRVRPPFARNPSPLQPSRLPLEYLLLPPRSALESVQPGVTPGGLPHWTPRPPTHWIIRHLMSVARCKRHAPAPSIFGAGPFGRWVVTHSLAGFDFHDHRPAVYMSRHPFWDPHARALRRFNLAFGSSRIASSAYQKRPTKSPPFVDYVMSRPGRSSRLTHLKFENRSRSLRPRNL